MARLFGTDGVRGTANEELTAELALNLSVAAAHVLGEAGAFSGHKPTALVGRDPRASGEFLEAAVVAGLASAGVDVVRLGVLPTPGVAYLVNSAGADLGVMLSASHNAMPDNGIKFFQRGGTKLDDTLEDAIEERLGAEWQRPVGAGVGRVTEGPDLVQQYIDHIAGSIDTDLAGLKVVVDCANGASCRTARAVFEAAGAEVVEIHADPTGLNINEACGSTHPKDLQEAVVAHGAALGVALDGDADRCIAVDADGDIVDGDRTLAVLALAMHEQDRLSNDTVVATVMSNLGFLNAMTERGLRVDQTKVGDRYVLESMRDNGFTLGGEQSGHVIMSEFATTGDGVLTGLHLMARVVETGRSLKDLGAVMTKLPQELVNVKGVDKTRAAIDPTVMHEVTTADQELGDTGRVLLRPSGTEPVVRVMVEAATQEQAREIAERLAAVVKERCAL